ncbi:MAG: GntR family transcriptional regulator [Chitinophagaceae bacterium]|nr:GntR family transcriptional regulator [Rubrivivax sp.]
MTERTLHEQVAEDLLQRVRAGEWPVGSSLPSEKVLSEQAGVSRHTLRHALARLRDRGLLEMRQGAPTKLISLTEPRVYSQDFNTLSEILRYPASTVRENKHESYIECDATLQPLLQAPLGSSWYHIGAVRRDEASGSPVAWADIYILGKFARVTKLKNHEREIVFEQIERHFGVAIDRAVVQVQAASLSKEHAQHLQAPAGSPCLMVLRRYFDSAGNPFEVTVTRHVPDRFTFSLELRNVGRTHGH